MMPPSPPCLPFIDLYLGKTPEERAKLLETTPLFERIHESAASSGQTAVPDDLDTDLHFTCFVRAPVTEPGSGATQRWRLIELDGGRIGPIDRGECVDLLKAWFYTAYFSGSVSRNSGHGEIRERILRIAGEECKLQYDRTLPRAGGRVLGYPNFTFAILQSAYTNLQSIQYRPAIQAGKWYR